MCKCNKCNKVKSNCNSNCEWCSYNPTTRQSCLPTPCVTGCLELVPFSCVEATVDYPDLNLLRGAKLDSIVTALIQLAQQGGVLAEQSFAFKTMTISEESLNSDRINVIDGEITAIKNTNAFQAQELVNINNTIAELNTLDKLTFTNSEVSLSKNGNDISVTIDMEKFLDKFIDKIKSSSILISKYKQLNVFTNDPENFALAPYEVTSTPGRTTLLIKWSDMGSGTTYDVYYRVEGEIGYNKLTPTMQLGITIPGLTPDTNYEVYVTSTNTANKVSAPSEIIKTKTSL